MALPVSAGTIRKLLREMAESRSGEQFVAVGGARQLAPRLRQQFLRGRAAPGAVRLGGPERADVYVHVLAGRVDDEDAALLRQARYAPVPAIAVAVGLAEDTTIPYVYATDVVWIGAGEPFPLETIAQVIAARLGERGAPLAAHVPLLREAVSGQLLASFALRNGLLAAARRSGADLPGLVLNELRLVLRLAQAYDAAGEVAERLPELAATVGTGFGLRALARELRKLAPDADWAVRVLVACAGTRALGEAARLRFALAPRPRPGGAARAWPGSRAGAA